MYKNIRLLVKLSVLFMIITAIYNYMAVRVMAANRIVNVKNGASAELRICSSSVTESTGLVKKDLRLLLFQE